MQWEIDELRTRITNLSTRIAKASESQARSVAETLEELRLMLSVLVASKEELCEKTEELLATRQALEVERQRYLELVEHAPDAYVITDLDGHIRQANQAAANLLQVRHDYLISKSLLLFVPEPDRTQLLPQLEQLKAMTLDILRNCQVMIRPRHEEPFSAIVTVVPVPPAGALPTKLHWVLREAVQHTSRPQD